MKNREIGIVAKRSPKTSARPKRTGAAAPTAGAAAGKRDGQPAAGKTRVAIIGGGCAGVAAAWQLSKDPQYEISVFERSWRLGGKGASGRTPDGQIVEHGLHVWLGFYENAFRMVRECYEEVREKGWGPGAKAPDGKLAHGRFEDAFFGEPHIGVTGLNAGEDVVWSGLLPPEKGLPGDPIVADTNPFTLANYLQRCVHLLKTLMLSVVGQPIDDTPGRARPETRSALDERVDLDFSIDASRSPELLIESVAGRVRDGTLTLAAALLQAVTIFENVLQELNHSPQAVGSVLNLLKALTSQARKQLRDVTTIDPRLRWKTEIIDIVMTIAVGLYRDRVLLGSKGLDAINDLDYREWLLKHGATKTSLKSPFLTGIYDLVFAYEGGDRTRPKLAAGVALRGALRMFFTYRGAMFWRMRSGMGDAVFAPLYKVLTRTDRPGPQPDVPLAPVSFHFLHELSGITFDPARRFVTGLTFKTLLRDGERPGGRGYDPARALDHFGCWPETPEQLAPPSRRRVETSRTLKAGQDFDFVIFATGWDDFASLLGYQEGKGITLTNPPKSWSAAFKTPRQTVGTIAAQVWFANNLKQLGWFRGSAIITALELAFDTWADMTPTLQSERAWRRAKPSVPKATAKEAGPHALDRARSVAYLCGVLADSDVGGRNGKALAEKLTTLLASIGKVWPDAEVQDVIRTHVRANVRGSDRYSLSLPGTIRDRLSPLDRSVLNVTVAGDWTACGLDAGCVEGAVISGMLAAHAITGTTPTLESIIGYDHP